MRGHRCRSTILSAKHYPPTSPPQPFLPSLNRRLDTIIVTIRAIRSQQIWTTLEISTKIPIPRSKLGLNLFGRVPILLPGRWEVDQAKKQLRRRMLEDDREAVRRTSIHRTCSLRVRSVGRRRSLSVPPPPKYAISPIRLRTSRLWQTKSCWEVACPDQKARPRITGRAGRTVFGAGPGVQAGPQVEVYTGVRVRHGKNVPKSGTCEQTREDCSFNPVVHALRRRPRRRLRWADLSYRLRSRLVPLI